MWSMSRCPCGLLDIWVKLVHILKSTIRNIVEIDKLKVRRPSNLRLFDIQFLPYRNWISQISMAWMRHIHLSCETFWIYTVYSPYRGLNGDFDSSLMRVKKNNRTITAPSAPLFPRLSVSSNANTQTLVLR